MKACAIFGVVLLSISFGIYGQLALKAKKMKRKPYQPGVDDDFQE